MNIKIRGKDVPLNGKPVPGYSTGMQIPRDKGWWDFWTAVCANENVVTVRCPTGKSPEERFNQESSIDPEAWKSLQNVRYVEPATESRIEKWLNKKGKEIEKQDVVWPRA